MIVNSLDEEIWSDFVDQHPQGNIFQTPEMFQVFARTFGYKPILWAVVDESQYPLCLLLPVEITIKGGVFYHWTTRSVVYGGVLNSPRPDSGEALKLVLKEYNHQMLGRFLFTEMRNLFDLSVLQPVLKESNFTFENHMNYLIDLDQSEETLWHNIKKGDRKSVRTSINKGTIIEEVTDKSQLLPAYRILQKVYTRVHIPLCHSTLFEAAYDILGSRGMFKIFLARQGDYYIGTCFLLLYKGRIIDWYAGTDRVFSSYYPGELLIWHILKWGKEHGFHVFDFGGAGKPSEEYGVRNFKAKFGGTAVYYGRNICIHSAIPYIISKQLYSWMRRISSFKLLNPIL